MEWYWQRRTEVLRNTCISAILFYDRLLAWEWSSAPMLREPGQRSQCSDYAAAIVNNLRAGWSGVRFSIGPRNCSVRQKWPGRLWDPPSLLFCGYQGSFLGLKCPELDVSHSPLSVAKVKNEWSCTFNPHIFLHGMKREILRLLLPPCWEASK